MRPFRLTLPVVIVQALVATLILQILVFTAPSRALAWANCTAPTSPGRLGGEVLTVRGDQNVRFTVLDGEATFINKVSLVEPPGQTSELIAPRIGVIYEADGGGTTYHPNDWGKFASLGTFAPNTELVFQDNVWRPTQAQIDNDEIPDNIPDSPDFPRNYQVKTGAASRNPDQVAHAIIEDLGPGIEKVRFADSLNQDARYDCDFNDAEIAVPVGMLDLTVNEGQAVTTSGDYTSGDDKITRNDVVSITSSIGSVTMTPPSGGVGHWTWSYQATDGPAQSQPVTLTTKIRSGLEWSVTFNLVVNNVAPTASLGNNGPVNEGSPATVSFMNPYDPSSDDRNAGFHYAFDCNGGSLDSANYGNTESSSSTTCTYPDGPSDHTVTSRIIDKDNGYHDDSTVVHVDNVPPTVNLSLDPEPSNEGAPVNAKITFSDPGVNDAPFTCQINWGDGTDPVAGTIDGGTCVVPSHTYADNLPNNAPYTVTASVTDKDNGTGSKQVSHVVDNVAPQVSCADPNPATINENDSTTLDCTIQDPGVKDSFTATIDWSDGTGETLQTISLAAGTTSFQTTHQYLDDNPTGTPSDVNPIKVIVTDKDQGVGDTATQVTVNNLNPTLTLTAPDQGTLYPVSNATVNLTGTFADIGTLDTHVAAIDWDDGTTSQCPPNTAECTLTETGGSGSIAATHTYSAAGVYTIQVTVTDDDTGSATQTVMVVVYDPSAGFVTGGGWLNSPAGAYAADPTLTGRANFGFVSKYQKGANVPTGQTEFQFQAGSLNFHSDSYQWLVVSGPKAQYRGTGTLNGVSGYTFLLTATDGDQPGGGGVDKFRIKIWNSGGVVYDNSPGASDDIDQANPEAIAGGSIVIHSN